MHMYVCPIPPSQKGKKNAQLNLKLTGGHRLVLLKTGQLISLCERKRKRSAMKPFPSVHK